MTQIQIPPHIQRAARTLGWTILQTGCYGGDTAYLVRDDGGFIEPYTARAILQSTVETQYIASPNDPTGIVVQCDLSDHERIAHA